VRVAGELLARHLDSRLNGVSISEQALSFCGQHESVRFEPRACVFLHIRCVFFSIYSSYSNNDASKYKATKKRKGLGQMMKSWIAKLTKGAVVQTAALLIVPVTCLMAFAACANVDGTPGVRNPAFFIRDVNSTKSTPPMPAPGLASNPRPPGEPYDLHADAYGQ
jgi:hypothetical protein